MTPPHGHARAVPERNEDDRQPHDRGEPRLRLEEKRGAGSNVAAAEAQGARAGWIPAAIGGLAGAAAVLGIWLLAGGDATLPERGASRLSLVLPSDIRFHSAAVTADGSRFVFTGTPRQRPGGAAPATRAYLRRADRFEATPIPGTEGIERAPVLRRDGRSMVFVAPASSGAAGRTLYSAPIDGGSPPTVLAQWNDSWESVAELVDGDLMILTDNGRSFVRLPAGGGSPGPAVPIDAGRFAGSFEATGTGAIGRRGVLLNGISRGPRGRTTGVALLDPETGKARILVEDGGNACLSPTGHLLFARGSLLLAAPFDPSRRTVKGPPVVVLDGLGSPPAEDAAPFSLASNGTLLLAPVGSGRPGLDDTEAGDGARARVVLDWFDELKREATKP